MICSLCQVLKGGKVKEHGMAGAYGTHRREERCIQVVRRKT